MKPLSSQSSRSPIVNSNKVPGSMNWEELRKNAHQIETQVEKNLLVLGDRKKSHEERREMSAETEDLLHKVHGQLISSLNLLWIQWRI